MSKLEKFKCFDEGGGCEERKGCGCGKTRLRVKQSLTGFTIKLMALSSSQAFTVGLLASLPILLKLAEEGADWMSEGPRSEV